MNHNIVPFDRSERHRTYGFLPAVPEREKSAAIICKCRLRNFDSESAIASLPKQLNLLQILGATKNENISLSYILRTEPGAAGVMIPIFDVVLNAYGEEAEIESWKKGFGNLIDITFRNVYSVKTKTNKMSLDETDYKESRHIVPVSKIFGGNQFIGYIAWSQIMDVLRSQPCKMKLELKATPLPEKPANSKPLGIRWHRPETFMENSREAALFFNSLLDLEGYEKLAFNYEICISSEEAISPVISEYIGNIISGDGHFEVLSDYSVLFPKKTFSNPVSAIHLLKLFHTPFGSITHTIGGGYVTNLLLNDVAFNKNKARTISLGKASYKTMLDEIETDVRMADTDRLQHTYFIGKTGTGKSNELKRMAGQDVKRREGGMTVIDPHGDLADYVLSCVPKEREKDVIFADFSDPQFAPVLNLFDVDRKDKALVSRVVDEALYLIKQQNEAAWCGPRFDAQARLAFMTMLDDGYPYSAALSDVTRILTDETYQNFVVPKLQNASLINQWKMERGRKRSNDYEDVIHWAESKFSAFSKDHILKIVTGGDHSTFDIEAVVRDGKILIVKIPQSVVGEYAADFIGSLIILKLKNAMMRRKYEAQDTPFTNHYIYIDEFQNFVGNFGSFSAMLAEARKFGIGLILANQNIEQLRQYDRHTGRVSTQMLDAILGNVGNVIAFKLGHPDAAAMAMRFDVPPQALMNIERYEAVARILVNGFETQAFSLRPEKAVTKKKNLVAQNIRATNRGTVLVDKEETLRQINRRTSIKETPPESSFLDTWLAKRQQQSHQQKKPDDGVALPALPDLSGIDW